jgi:hypothetical protein
MSYESYIYIKELPPNKTAKSILEFFHSSKSIEDFLKYEIDVLYSRISISECDDDDAIQIDTSQASQYFIPRVFVNIRRLNGRIHYPYDKEKTICQQLPLNTYCDEIARMIAYHVWGEWNVEVIAYKDLRSEVLCHLLPI